MNLELLALFRSHIAHSVITIMDKFLSFQDVYPLRIIYNLEVMLFSKILLLYFSPCIFLDNRKLFIEKEDFKRNISAVMQLVCVQGYYLWPREASLLHSKRPNLLAVS